MTSFTSIIMIRKKYKVGIASVAKSMFPQRKNKRSSIALKNLIAEISQTI